MAKRNYCFVCGPYNREGLRLKFQYDSKAASAHTYVRIPRRYQGATGFAHGGIIATLLDEAMAKTNGLSGIRAVTAQLQVKYRKLVPVDQKLRLIGWKTGRRGKRLFLRAELRGEDHVLAEARGIFIAWQPKTDE